jgi:dihydrofolate reductase
MRKLKVQVQTSIDGFIAGPGGEMDWMVRNWDNELRKFVFNLTRPVDCIVMGRNLAHGFIDNWLTRLNEASTNDTFAKKMVETPKVVFSHSMEHNPWKNTRLVNGDLKDEIIRLKQMKGRDIIAYGGVTFLSSLIETDLIDEYNIFVNPVALGKGKSLFTALENKLNLQLVYSTSFDCGITALCYVKPPKEQNSESAAVTSDIQSEK